MSKKPSFNVDPVKVDKTRHEVDQVTNAATEQINSGTSKYPGMTYEEGVRAALDWITGDIDDDPMND